MAGSNGSAGSGQSQPAEGHGDQSEHQGHGATGYSLAGAETTCGDSQIQHAVDHVLLALTRTWRKPGPLVR